MSDVLEREQLVEKFKNDIRNANNIWCIQMESIGYNCICNSEINRIDFEHNVLIIWINNGEMSLRDVTCVTKNEDIPGVIEYIFENESAVITFTHSSLD